jgi:hypothetical protein
VLRSRLDAEAISERINLLEAGSSAAALWRDMSGVMLAQPPNWLRYRC